MSMLVMLAAALAAPVADYRARPPEDEIIYFLLPDRFENGDRSNDRGGLTGGPLKTGYDPTRDSFYHGGDLKGLRRRLDYIAALGATAIWVGPVFRNKPVQGAPGQESAGYHGYWITDFTRVDPHFGSDADFRALVDAAHAKGMKVYMDIIANHTADVIQYRGCGATPPCPYRSRADFPYQRRGGPDGAAINRDFAGDDVRTAANFARLTDPSYAYEPFVPERERGVKVPGWLNDVRLYHNRGDTTFTNESATMGDFVGLDDLMTENPRVVEGMIDIYGSWIDRYGIDGFRIDTARHVDPEFWQAFVPAMLARAKARGIPHFHIFGEVAWDTLDAGRLARHTRVDRLPATLDFVFREAVRDSVAGNKPTELWEGVIDGDALYAEGDITARRLPTFVSNHDQGRMGYFIRRANPQADDAEVLKRTMLANAMLLTWRGVPTIYAGDEQGFAGDGGDGAAREDMFPSKVASYNDNRLIGSDRTTAVSNFDTGGVLFRQIAALARLRRNTPALRRGLTKLRHRQPGPGLLAVSRIDPDSGREVLLAFNTAAVPVAANVAIEVGPDRLRPLAGACPATTVAPGSVALSLPAFGYAVCAVERSK